MGISAGYPRIAWASGILSDPAQAPQHQGGLPGASASGLYRHPMKTVVRRITRQMVVLSSFMRAKTSSFKLLPPAVQKYRAELEIKGTGPLQH
jgi:hypothetical protein